MYVENIKQFNKKLSKMRFIDNNYPVSGSNVWHPQALFIWRKFKEILFLEMKEIGYDEYSFPSLLSVENAALVDKIKIFSESNLKVFDQKKLNSVLRPTGEASIYPMFKSWIESYRHLPLKIMQDVIYYRHTDKVGPFFGKREYKILEGHAIFSNRENALDGLRQVNQLLSLFLEKINIPFYQLERPLFGNQPLNERVIGFDTLLPFKKTAQVACSYLQSNIFSKLFNIQFTDNCGTKKYTEQITWGVPESLIGAYMLTHFDDKGFFFESKIAPVQIVLLPVSFDEKIINFTNTLKSQLEKQFRVIIDSSDKTIGSKHFFYEESGVVMRVVVGKKEVDNKELHIMLRDGSVQKKVSIDKLNSKLIILFDKYDQIIKNRVYKKNLSIDSSEKEMVHSCSEFGISKINACNNDKCLKKIEKNNFGEILGSTNTKSINGFCMSCGSKANKEYLFGRRL